MSGTILVIEGEKLSNAIIAALSTTVNVVVNEPTETVKLSEDGFTILVPHSYYRSMEHTYSEPLVLDDNLPKNAKKPSFLLQENHHIRKVRR